VCVYHHRIIITALMLLGTVIVCVVVSPNKYFRHFSVHLVVVSLKTSNVESNE